MCSDPRRFRGLVLVLLGGAVVEADDVGEGVGAMAVVASRAPARGNGPSRLRHVFDEPENSSTASRNKQACNQT
ncbi:MAG: hypothetical protein WBM08_14960 [Prochlorococcaceae cyanobacterium]